MNNGKVQPKVFVSALKVGVYFCFRCKTKKGLHFFNKGNNVNLTKKAKTVTLH